MADRWNMWAFLSNFGVIKAWRLAAYLSDHPRITKDDAFRFLNVDREGFERIITSLWLNGQIDVEGDHIIHLDDAERRRRYRLCRLPVAVA